MKQFKIGIKVLIYIFFSDLMKNYKKVYFNLETIFLYEVWNFQNFFISIMRLLFKFIADKIRNIFELKLLKKNSVKISLRILNGRN